MFQMIRNGSLEYLKAPALDSFDFLIHAFCTRRGGVSKGPFSSLNVSSRGGDDRGSVRQNFERIASAFGFSAGNLLPIHQVHSDAIWIVDQRVSSSEGNQPPDFDAVVTGRPAIALCIKTADCVPILLADPVRRVIGAVHAGWKGTALRIAAKTADTLIRRFDASPRDIRALIGPSIGPCCYEVDLPVFEAMAGHTGQSSFFARVPDRQRWMLDLPLANRIQLLDRGILPEHIFSTGLCTSCRKDIFFSHRREAGQTGRQLNFIMLRGDATAACS
jgi:YfiH family protein